MKDEASSRDNNAWRVHHSQLLVDAESNIPVTYGRIFSRVKVRFLRLRETFRGLVSLVIDVSTVATEKIHIRER